MHCPLLSLPGVFHKTGAKWPATVPYLQADPKLVQHWKTFLHPLRGFKIGIAWQGNPLFRDDHRRSMPLAAFGPLSELEDVQLISLQKGPGTDQVAEVTGQEPGTTNADSGFSAPVLDEAAGPFMDTAAIMKNLDLVITCDTAIAHLAGALGVPVWVALSDVPDWRWQLQRPDSPWYPTMRLFRQGAQDHWVDVFERIADEVVGLHLTQRRKGAKTQ